MEHVLNGGSAEIIPFTMYECMIPQCVAERRMRNRGLCVVNRRGVYTTHRPNVKMTQEHYVESGHTMIRTRYETPVGTVQTVVQPVGFTSWYHEHMFKTPDDYKVLFYIINDEIHAPEYEAFSTAEKRFGGDAIFRASFGLEPLQALISGVYMGTETFCVEWMDRRDEVLKLYQALVDNRRKIYPLVANSPASHANYGGNVVPEIIGLDTFEKYYVPHYNEAAEIMHKQGKLIGCHFDANCRVLADAIADTGLDYIEAFTPAPDTDMTLAEAREKWAAKVLWLNFPSSLHLRTDKDIVTATIIMLSELKSQDGIIMGITEDIPPDRWQQSCNAIMDGLEQFSRGSRTVIDA